MHCCPNCVFSHHHPFSYFQQHLKRTSRLSILLLDGDINMIWSHMTKIYSQLFMVELRNAAVVDCVRFADVPLSAPCVWVTQAKSSSTSSVWEHHLLSEPCTFMQVKLMSTFKFFKLLRNTGPCAGALAVLYSGTSRGVPCLSYGQHPFPKKGVKLLKTQKLFLLLWLHGKYNHPLLKSKSCAFLNTS